MSPKNKDSRMEKKKACVANELDHVDDRLLLLMPSFNYDVLPQNREEVTFWVKV